MIAQGWRVRLGGEAEQDFSRILLYTKETFGQRQMAIYRETLIDALKALATGPAVPGSIARDEIQAGLRSLHIARHGRTGRHFIIYRAAPDDTIEVVRILHEAMDLARHVPPK